MYSKVKLAGHPVHPMLVSFPIALYTATLVCMATYAANDNPFWFRAGWYANAAAVVTAIVAALPGFIDWAVGIPRGTAAKKTGLAHMLLNVTALILFAANVFVLRPELDAALPRLGPGLVLPILGFAATLIAGFLGWRMVQKHHVGVDLTPEQERIDPNLVVPTTTTQAPPTLPTQRPTVTH
jgi:uncharacterized membrane protein